MPKKELCFLTTNVKSVHRTPPNSHQPSSFCRAAFPTPMPGYARTGRPETVACPPWAMAITQGVAQGKRKTETEETSRAPVLAARCLPQTASRVEGPAEQDLFKPVWSGESSAWEKQHKNYSVFSFGLSPAFPCIPREVFLWVHAGRGTSWKPGAAHGRQAGRGGVGLIPRLPGKAALWEMRSLHRRCQPWHS